MPLAPGVILAVSWREDFASQRYLFTHTYRVLSNSSTSDTAQDTAYCVLHFSDTGTGTMTSRLRSCIGSNVIIREVVCQPIWPQRLVKRSISTVYNGPGGSTSTTGNVSSVITLRTVFAGRNQVANKHVGPPPKDDIAAGLLIGTTPIALQNFGATLVSNQTVPADGANTIVLVPVIFHKDTGGHDIVVSSVASDRVGTMRRRTLRVGE